MRALTLVVSLNLLLGPWLIWAQGEDDGKVTCGSVVKVQHQATRFRLHSHDIPYGSGSGQQSVTGFGGGDDNNCYWIVHGTEGEPCSQGEPIPKGRTIRLQHARTRRWLHSHFHRSPLSRNQEISAFGGDGDSDGGDEWMIEWDDRKKFWMRDMKVYFKHVETGAYLLTHDRKYSNPIPGQQEVCGIQNKKDKNTIWFAGEGVYFPNSQSSVHDEL